MTETGVGVTLIPLELETRILEQQPEFRPGPSQVPALAQPIEEFP
jgi:hypothetical protein